MSLIVICLIGTELGYLFFMKRELQKMADLAALAGARSIAGTSCMNAKAAALDNANNTTTGNMPKGLNALAPGEIVCGTWTPAGQASNSANRFTPAISNMNAVQVAISRSPALLLPFFSGDRTIAVSAIAAQALPQAQLNIRSTLLSVNTEASALNTVLGGLLGTSLDLSAAGWQALVTTNVNLLDYLVALGATAGDYETVLDTPISIGHLIEVAATVLGPGATTDLAIALGNVTNAAKISTLPEIKLGELLNIAAGTPTGALNASIQVFQLIQGSIQLASKGHAATAAFTVPVSGVANVTAQIQVIEPPKVSAIGNPQLVAATSGPTDPNRIYVRTAQVRTLFSLQLGSQSGTSAVLQNTLDSVANALSPIANFLQTVSTLNLSNIVGQLVSGLVICAPCQSSKEVYAVILSSAKIDVSLDAASGSAYVSAHSCTTDTNKSLVVQGGTSLSKLRVGKITNAFSASQAVDVAPVSIVEIGYRETRYELCLIPLLGTLTCSNQTWKTSSGSFVAAKASAQKTAVAGLGLKLDTPVGGSSAVLTYSAPAPEALPDIDAAPYAGAGSDPSYKSITSQSLVGSLSPSLAGITLSPYSSQSGGVLGSLLVGTISLINSLLSTLQGTVTSLLSPLLDPSLNILLDALGVNLAKTDVGARLSCSRGAELVY
ncbi:hypothetical protein J2W36_004628 [Variovorax ginsengisoli]|uniref:DUF2134 domain-containing protein n=2 Tax=Variovorax ginsengisoli TaxID=363844 RepID=A0ABT9SDB7_9BURK|nr:hypothetical protein [Variovorax ginsengisoli]